MVEGDKANEQHIRVMTANMLEITSYLIGR